MDTRTSQFQKTVRDYYTDYQRDLPWRRTTDPYKIFISEIMLQQTQVARVVSQYEQFIRRFPDFEILAKASLCDILKVWQGLGYNRRALMLQKAAQMIVQQYHGQLPKTPEELIKLPGIGQSTAGSIATFAFNYPAIFVETNIRRVFIHHFFENQRDIADDQIYPLINQTIDRQNPRQWYWALMDYGSMLGKIMENPNRKSRHYTRQSTFQGSNRQLRGRIIRLLTQNDSLRADEIVTRINSNYGLTKKLLNGLEGEGFIQQRLEEYFVAP